MWVSARASTSTAPRAGSRRAKGNSSSSERSTRTDGSWTRRARCSGPARRGSPAPAATIGTTLGRTTTCSRLGRGAGRVRAGGLEHPDVLAQHEAVAAPGRRVHARGHDPAQRAGHHGVRVLPRHRERAQRQRPGVEPGRRPPWAWSTAAAPAGRSRPRPRGRAGRATGPAARRVRPGAVDAATLRRVDRAQHQAVEVLGARRRSPSGSPHHQVGADGQPQRLAEQRLAERGQEGSRPGFSTHARRRAR